MKVIVEHETNDESYVAVAEAIEVAVKDAVEGRVFRGVLSNGETWETEPMGRFELGEIRFVGLMEKVYV